jgi:apolipoprotein N-acyltransferase
MGRLLWVMPAVAISGILFLLSLPPADVMWLGWLALAPLFTAVVGRGLAIGALSGLGVCLFAAYLSTTGIFYLWDRLEGDPGWHYVGFLLFGIVMSIVCGALGELKRVGLRHAIMLAALAVLLEAALLLYLPAHLALTQYKSPAMMRLAEVTGIWGVSFLVWFSNLALAVLPHARPLKIAQHAAVAWVVILMATTVLWRWPQPLAPDEATFHQGHSEGQVVVAVLQTTSMELEDLERLNREATRLGADLVIWPELSATGAVAGGDTEQVRELSASAGQAAFVTTFPDAASPMPYNVASLFNGGRESDRYKKRKPFGGESKMHQAGSEARSVAWERGQLGLNVCFDSCFPNVMRETSRLQDVTLIALPCMGPETPYGFVQAIHGAYTPFRSAENGVPIARGESSAFAMITDSRGRILAEAPAGYVGPLLAAVELERRPTLYRQFGDWFLILSGLTFIACWVLGRRPSAT